MNLDEQMKLEEKKESHFNLSNILLGLLVPLLIFPIILIGLVVIASTHIWKPQKEDYIRKIGLFDFGLMDRILDGKGFFEYRVDGKKYDIPSWFGIRKRLKFLKLLIKSDTFVIQNDGKPIGFITSNNGIIGMFVKERFRRRGFGTKLLNFIEGKAQTDKFRIQVDKNNPAVEFWKKSGYRITRYIMEKEIE